MEIEEWIKKLVEYDGEKLNRVLTSGRKPEEVIDPIYFTDAYPRCGCRMEIEVLEGRCYLRVYAPSGQILEAYRPPSAELGRYVQEWMDGIAPRIKPLGQSQGQSLPDKAG